MRTYADHFTRKKKGVTVNNQQTWATILPQNVPGANQTGNPFSKI